MFERGSGTALIPVTAREVRGRRVTAQARICVRYRGQRNFMRRNTARDARAMRVAAFRALPSPCESARRAHGAKQRVGAEARYSPACVDAR